MLVLSRQRDETIMIGDDVEITIVDIRDRLEIHAQPLDDVKHINIPADQLLGKTNVLDAKQRYLLCCGIGFRSRNLAELLRQRGHTNVFSQRGGIAALRAERL